MEDIILENKILLSKKYSAGIVYILEMSRDMVIVVAFDKNKKTLCARNFLYTEEVKKEVLKNARRYFKKVQKCLCQKKLNMIEELDFD